MTPQEAFEKAGYGLRGERRGVNKIYILIRVAHYLYETARACEHALAVLSIYIQAIIP
jgi:hypothetical protein